MNPPTTLKSIPCGCHQNGVLTSRGSVRFQSAFTLSRFLLNTQTGFRVAVTPASWSVGEIGILTPRLVQPGFFPDGHDVSFTKQFRCLYVSCCPDASIRSMSSPFFPPRPLSAQTRLCMSLSGRPGTFGTRFHNHLYAALGLDYVYKAFTTTDLPAAVAGVRALGIRGCAVSMPFKEACVALVDELDPSAAAIGSVNTIVNTGGVLRAYNTDYLAVRQLVDEYDIDPALRLVLRGSGGMARAVACALRDAGFASGTVLARSEAAGRALAAQCGYVWQSELTGQPELLINVTPIGMAGGPESGELAFDLDKVAAAQVVFDVVALPAETPLIRAARAAGKIVISGAEVAVRQSLEQFVLYTGAVPSAEQVQAAADYARQGG